MTDAQAAFDDLVRRVHNDLLKSLGFKKSRATFRRHTTEAWLLIEFQKSRRNDHPQVTFTVNLGVALDALREHDGGSGEPGIPDCHWRERLGFLLPSHTDEWWTITRRQDVPDVAAFFIQQLRDVALPALEVHATNEALRRLWSSGMSPGLTDFQRARYLVALEEAFPSGGD